MTRDQHLEWAADTSTCFACGSRDWRSIWYGEAAVAVCCRCATEVLPRLIADALPYTTPVYVDGALADLQREYWRAVALRLQRERDDRPRRRGVQ